jgi:hypothetical protein
MNIIKTTAPISIDLLKGYFSNPDTKFIINYKESKLQGSKLLTYLSNLDVPSDIEFENDFEFFELLKVYLESSFLLNIDSLENATIAALFTHKGIEINEKYLEFVKENSNILDEWKSRLESLLIYNLYTIDSEEIKSLLNVYERVDGRELQGINFVSLLKHEKLYLLYDDVEESNLKFYQGYFTEYMFKGKNLYSFWSNENNPLFLLTFGIANGVNIKDYLESTSDA